MNADISADTFRPSRHFDSVVVGQGQVLVDSAINEQSSIDRHREATTTSDVVGPSGAPKDGGGFAVTVAPDGLDLLLSPGRMYVDGIVCVNEPPAVGAAVVSTTALVVDTAVAGGVRFAPGQWIDVAGTGSTTRVQVVAVAGRSLTLQSSVAGLTAGTPVTVTPVTSLRHQPDRPTFDPFAAGDPTRLAANAYRVELDVWHRHISELVDPSIREVALGDAESSTRLKVVWQVRVAPAGAVGGGSCAVPAGPHPAQLIASTVPGAPSDDPCELPDEAGYRGLENQLYRVEVHSATPSGVVLKWQRDNASTSSPVLSLGSTLLLDGMGRDNGFTSAAYVEVTDEALTLEQAVSDLLAVTAPPEQGRRTIGLAGTPSAARLDRNPVAIVWDGRIDIDLTSPSAAAPVALERGVQVVFVPGAARSGDYWLIPARTSNSAGGGSITWPTADDGVALPRPPHGTRHHVESLAIVDATAATFSSAAGSVRECRALFPPLTAITASDVSVDPVPCAFTGVATVQDAIDALCQRGSGLCTATATPGPGWEKVFDSIPAGADAQVCFPIGTYDVAAPVAVSGKGHLVLHGAGAGSVLAGTGTETIITFVGCASVTVQSLAARGGTGAQGGIGGILTFTNCGAVTVRDCTFTGAAQTTRQASCLRTTGGSLTVEGSRFDVGDRQVGVLATNPTGVSVTGSQFTVATPPAGPAGPVKLTALEKAQARRLLLSDLATTAAGKSRVGVKIGAQTFSFATTPVGATVWPAVLTQSFTAMRDFQTATDKVLRTVFAGTATAAAAPLVQFVQDRIVSRRVAVMAQAIVVGGSSVGDVRITGNDIHSAVQGVHVAASQAGPRAGSAALFAGRVTISGNRIGVLVPPEGARGRHAIFVGNAAVVRIDANDISYDSRAEGDRITTEGVRVFGFITQALIVRDNVVDSFPGGIALHLFQLRGKGEGTRPRVYAAEDNLLIGSSGSITVTGPLSALVTFRGNRPGPPDKA